jgi:hypothetical protein
VNPNPFEVLRLEPSTSEEEIVRQAGRLRQRAPDETTRDALRRAVQALTASAEDRRLLSLLTHPAPCHHDPILERFKNSFRRPPVVDSAPTCPALDKTEFASLLSAIAAEELQLPALPFESIEADESPEEIERQTAEAAWQNLMFDPGA